MSYIYQSNLNIYAELKAHICNIKFAYTFEGKLKLFD